MKRTSTLCLMAIFAIACMAFVGTASTMAASELEKVVLCKGKGDPCFEGGDYEAGTVFHTQLVEQTTSELLTNFGTGLCTSSAAKGKTTSLLADGELESFTFGGCTLDLSGGGTQSCTVVSEHLNYLVKAWLEFEHETYEVVMSAKNNGNPQIKVTCGSFVSCKFSAPELSFEVLLDNEAGDVVLDVLQELERAGVLCPKEAIWHAKYLFRCLEPLGTYVSCYPKME